MSETMIHVDHVWKKFRKGEIHDSLRELIPAMAKRLVGRGGRQQADLGDREFWALRDVSFEVKRGESLGIIGPNGAGKSTMLKLLSRIIKPNRGSYYVHGRLSALIEVGAGFHPDLTGRENIYLNGTILGMSRKEIRAKEEEIIDFSGVEEFIETPVKRYSSGMKARLGFSVAAHMEPDVLLVDEVLSVGDARFRQKCLRHMRELIASDVTVIFISHMLEQVRSLCPTTLVLDHGKDIYHGPTEGAISAYLDALGNDSGEDQQQEAREAELRDIQLCDDQGHEVLEWKTGQPAMIECNLVLHQPIVASIQMNLSTIDGRYVGTAHLRCEEVEIPPQPGVYPIRFTFDPMPLADGAYTLNLRVSDYANKRCVWKTGQPRTVSVRGGGAGGAIIRMEGHWNLVGQPSALPVSLET